MRRTECVNAHARVCEGRGSVTTPPTLKPFVKRHKNDTTDAEATSEAAQRPTMHLVAVKTEEQQARGMLFRTRDLLVRQRTQTIVVKLPPARCSGSVAGVTGACVCDGSGVKWPRVG